MDRNWLPTTQSSKRVSKLSQEREFSRQRLSDETGLFAASLSAETMQFRELGAHVFDISAVVRVFYLSHNFNEWVVETIWIELHAPHSVIEPVSVLARILGAPQR
jgi:hypothetical protein